MSAQHNITQHHANQHVSLSPAGEDRGPVLEVIVSRTNFISSHTSKTVRVVGLSTALANARDLADWLGIKQVRGRPEAHCRSCKDKKEPSEHPAVEHTTSPVPVIYRVYLE